MRGGRRGEPNMNCVYRERAWEAAFHLRLHTQVTFAEVPVMFVASYYRKL